MEKGVELTSSVEELNVGDILGLVEPHGDLEGRGERERGQQRKGGKGGARERRTHVSEREETAADKRVDLDGHSRMGEGSDELSVLSKSSSSDGSSSREARRSHGDHN